MNFLIYAVVAIAIFVLNLIIVKQNKFDSDEKAGLLFVIPFFWPLSLILALAIFGGCLALAVIDAIVKKF